MKLIYDKTLKAPIIDRIIFLFYGKLRLRLWTDGYGVKFKLQSKTLKGFWDDSSEV